MHKWRKIIECPDEAGKGSQAAWHARNDTSERVQHQAIGQRGCEQGIGDRRATAGEERVRIRDVEQAIRRRRALNHGSTCKRQHHTIDPRGIRAHCACTVLFVYPDQRVCPGANREAQHFPCDLAGRTEATCAVAGATDVFFDTIDKKAQTVSPLLTRYAASEADIAVGENPAEADLRTVAVSDRIRFEAARGPEKSIGGNCPARGRDGPTGQWRHAATREAIGVGIDDHHRGRSA